jgi:K+-transporting ATPase KdpF subunit
MLHRARSLPTSAGVTLEHIAALGLALALTIYLVYALLRPEKF